MNNSLVPLSDDVMLALVAGGDCSRLSPAQKMAYYRARCDAAGLDPRTQPFGFIRTRDRRTGEAREVLYALKATTDQLSAIHGIVCEIVSQATEGGIRTVTVRAKAKDGRQTDDIGAVNVQGLQGDDLCNALMRAVTKAKRRAILSLCGLGMLDETELDTMGDAMPAHVPALQPSQGGKPTPWGSVSVSSSAAGASAAPPAPKPALPPPPPQPPPPASSPKPAPEKNGPPASTPPAPVPNPPPAAAPKASASEAKPPTSSQPDKKLVLVLVEAVTRGAKKSAKGGEYWGVKLGEIGSTEPSRWYSTWHQSVYETAKAAQKSLKKFFAEVEWHVLEDGRSFGWVNSLVEQGKEAANG